MRRPGLPVELRVEGRHVLVIGGGPDAEDKVERVLAAGARVTLIDPSATPALAAAAAAGRIAWRRRPYRPADLDEADVVLLTTRGVPEQAERLRAECRARRVLLWTHDYLPGCDFTMTALVEAGPVRLAVSTGGRAPGLAAAVARVLRRLFDADFAAWADAVAVRRHDPTGPRPADLRVEGRLRWDPPAGDDAPDPPGGRR